ncbi:MAG: hypothetical protein COA69_04030 [Robiginitomaculum sp.]|nr:MAG: hypothetical protein COA69_04030 [Robiginitomaculum sp.]
MEPFITHTEILADRKADRETYGYVFVFTFASWVVLSMSQYVEKLEHDPDARALKSWIEMGSSHLVVAVGVLAIPFILSFAPLSRERMKTSIPIHIVACIGFSAVHILLMVGVRKIMYWFWLGETLDFGLRDFNVWMYEFRKDAYTYALVVLMFQVGRQVVQLRLELAAARTEAKQNHRLSLKSGGRSIFLDVDDVIWAKAASNYVEVHTETSTHLARMTLSRLKSLLEDAGPTHVQTHRSYIVRRDAIREIIPTGDGDAKLVLNNGDTVPVSRGYRAGLDEVRVA